MRRLQLLYPKYYNDMIIFKKYMPVYILDFFRNQRLVISNAPKKPSNNVITQNMRSDNAH